MVRRRRQAVTEIFYSQRGFLLSVAVAVTLIDECRHSGICSVVISQLEVDKLLRFMFTLYQEWEDVRD
eukprot:g30298.t1